MNLRQLHIFVEVAKVESVTQASKTLFLAQPAVSQAIAQLEEEFQILLFRRVHPRIFLTDEGKQLLPFAIAILEQVEEFNEQANQLSSKPKIMLGCSLSVAEHVLPKWMHGYENLSKVYFQYRVENSHLLCEEIVLGNLDLAIVEGLVTHPSIEVLNLYQDRLCLVAAPSWPYKTISHAHLSTIAFLLRDEKSGTRVVWEQKMNAIGMKINPILTSSSNTSLLRFAEQNIGVAVVSYSVAKTAIAEGKLVECTIENITLERSISLIYRKKKVQSAALKDFIQYLLTVGKKVFLSM